MKQESASSRPRVVAVSNLYWLPWEPTRGTFNQQIFDALAEHVDVHFLVPVSWMTYLRNFREVRHFAQFKRPSGVTVYLRPYFYLPGFFRSLIPVSMAASLAVPFFHLLKKIRPSAVVASWLFPDAVAVARLCQNQRVPLLAIALGSDIHLHAKVPARHKALVKAMQVADYVVCVSRDLANNIVDMGIPARKVKTNYNGVDVQAFRRRDKAQASLHLQLDPTRTRVLFVGNLISTKGCSELLAAFAQLAQTRPLLDLVFVGDGNLSSSLKTTAAKLGLADRVLFLGRKPHDALPWYFASCDLFCLPSYTEGVPNVVMEAMACGIPVVATTVGGIPEVLPEWSGLMVSPRNEAALATALETALQTQWEPERIHRHAASFSWEDNARMLAGLIRDASLGGAAIFSTDKVC